MENMENMENQDMDARIDQMKLENRSHDYIVGKVADKLEKDLRYSFFLRSDYVDMARNTLNLYEKAKANRNKNTEPKEKSFTFETANSPAKQAPECAPTWSESWSSEEQESLKSRNRSRSKQRTRVSHTRAPLTTAVNQKSKSPKRRGRSPPRSPGPQTTSNMPPRHRSRSRPTADRPYPPNLSPEHVSTRRSKSPVPNRSPFRSVGESSPSVYYDCDSSFANFRQSSPSVARNLESTAVNEIHQSFGNLYVNGTNSEAFRNSAAGMNSSFQNMSMSVKEPGLNSSFQNMSVKPGLNGSFQNMSVNEKKFSFDESPGKASATAGASPRAKLEPKTPVGASTGTDCPGTCEFSPLSPQSTYPEVGAFGNASSSKRAQPSTSTGKSPTAAAPPRARSRSRSPVRDATTFDARSSANAKKPEPTPPTGKQNVQAMPFASPVPEFQAPHQVFAESVPRGWRNVRPSPEPYMDANSPSFPNGHSQKAAQDPPAPTGSSSFGGDNPAVVGQTTTNIQFSVDLNKPLRDRMKKGKSKRGLRGKTGSTRRSDNNVKPASFNPAASTGVGNFAQASPSNSTPPQAMDCGTPAQPNLNDIQFNIGVGDKSTVSKPRMKKRDVKPTPVPPHVPQPEPVQQQPPILFNLGVGGKSPKSKSRMNKRSSPKAKRSQSAYFQSETMASVSQSVQQDHYPRSYSAHESNPVTIRAAREAAIRTLRDEAKAHYSNKDFHGAVLKFSLAISQYRTHCNDSPNKHLLAVLLSNRAACLMNFCAYRAAAEDCEQGLDHTPPVEEAQSLDDFSPGFKAKLLCRMARAHIQLGEVDKAENLFDQANKNISETLVWIRHDEVAKMTLFKIRNDLTNGIMDIGKFREAMKKIMSFINRKNHTLRAADREKEREDVLVHVNFVLSMASGCDELHEQKVSLLADLKRWREVAGYCERLAASRTKLDGCFVEDLASKNPFVGVGKAENLSVDFFKGTDETDIRGATYKLNHNAAAEVVLRLPNSIIPYYARSLRLEERYPMAEAVLTALETHIISQSGAYGAANLRNQFEWVPKEQQKLSRTKSERTKGDTLFKQCFFEQAAAQYEFCLNIDSDGTPDPSGGKNAGGRLHAVLHCNRAASLMLLERWHEAAAECTTALRIHPLYMKAMSRRARCFGKMSRHEECIAEFRRLIDLVNKARRGSLLPKSPCFFDGPSDATDRDLATAKSELAEAIKAQEKAQEHARAAEANWKKSQQNSRFNNNPKKGDAQRRREAFYNQKNDSRRWDSFSNRGPKRSHSKPRSKTSSQSKDSSRHSYKKSTSWSSSTGSGSSNGSQDRRPADITKNSDHYSVLGLNRNASAAEIKKAFRKMALKYHPDKNQSDDAADIFRRMNEAHEVLRDTEKRSQYDLELQFGGSADGRT
eukprot:CAMPEP_0113603610 /NCGR_PEP_ID=MMETSP0017_2-20120614/1366_1 /TAXON_ID=2856 /ORGANISM="Cylindrotheca closterium" /LENGTH=1393 /DNA_ID=CAMNT_0000512005 /DNA_START=108 /DNA_END=4286 /DNA_ORIENTATION=- /assembly_acc=CAM_ASM_000147